METEVKIPEAFRQGWTWGPEKTGHRLVWVVGDREVAAELGCSTESLRKWVKHSLCFVMQ